MSGSRIGCVECAPDAGVMVSWSNLHEQFGDGYASVKKFRQNFLHALRQAMAVYPAARVDQVRGGLRPAALAPADRQEGCGGEAAGAG